MKKTASMILMMVFLHTLHSATFAQTPQSLKGTWVVDIKATEEFFKNSPPPPEDLQFIPLSSGLMFQMIYEFTDSAIAMSVYTSDQSEKKLMYQLLPGQDNKLAYVSEIKQAGRDDIWIVNIISDENISISSSQNPATKYFILKRVKLDPNKRAEDGKRAFEAWKVWAQDMAPILAPKTTFTWKEEVLLHDGKTIIVERSVERGGRHEIGQKPPIKEQSLTFNLPSTNENITWEDRFTEDVGSANFLPMLLDVRKDMAYLVVHPMGSLSYMKWGSPNPPYVVFKYQNKRWNRITLQELPIELIRPNLILSSPDDEAKKVGQRIISAEAIKRLYDSYRQLEFKTIHRTPLDHWKPRPQGSNSGRMVRTGDGGWIGMDWFEKQPSLEACLKKCAREKVSLQDCPCHTLFKDK